MFIVQPLQIAALVVAAVSVAPQSGTGSKPVGNKVLDTNDCAIVAPLACEGQPTTFSSQFAGTNYLWTLSNNTAGAFFCGPTNQQSVCVDTTQPGTFRLQLDYVLQSGPKTCVVEVPVNPALTVADLVGDTVCEGEGVVLSTTVLSGNGPFTYSWTFDDGSGPVVIAGANTDTLVLTNVSLANSGTYCVTVGGQCGPVTSCAALEVENCDEGDDHCTLTQGAYGSAGGYWNGLSTIELLDQLLATDLVVGKPGRSLRIQAGNASCVLARLPANSSPAALPAIGDATLNASTCQTSPVALPLKNGKFKNVLLGQTLTLSLNTRLDGTLADQGICESMTTQLLAAGPDGLMGTADDVVDPGLDGILGTADDVFTVTISTDVIDALANLGLPITVGGLLELANRALAAQSTDVADASEINGAVDAINRGFDECRRLLACTNG